MNDTTIRKKDKKARLLLAVHAVLVFSLALLLFISKWFPYGPYLPRIREWLYHIF